MEMSILWRTPFMKDNKREDRTDAAEKLWCILQCHLTDVMAKVPHFILQEITTPVLIFIFYSLLILSTIPWSACSFFCLFCIAFIQLMKIIWRKTGIKLKALLEPTQSHPHSLFLSLSLTSAHTNKQNLTLREPEPELMR